MVDAARPKAHLGDFEPASFPPEDIAFRHADVGKADVHMAVWCVVVAKDVHRAEDFDAGRVHWHKDLALLAEGFGLGRCFDHHDHDLAARIACAGDIELLSVDDPFAVVEHGGGGDVFGIGGGHIRLCHGESGADLTGQQGFEPFFLLLGRADAFEDFHVAGIRCGAVQRL